MNTRLFKESILYGNLELIYSDRLIKKINFAEFFKIVKNFEINKESIYRFMVNINYVINHNDVAILNNIEKAEIILAIFDFLVKKSKIDIEKVNIENTIDIVVCSMIHSFNFKVNQYLGVYSLVEIIKKKLDIKYRKIIDFVEKNTIIFDRFKPFEENIWTSSWKLFFKRRFEGFEAC